MARYRVGAEGLRVTTARGTYTLPPDVVLDDIPEQYEGKLLVETLDEIDLPKRVGGYENKVIRVAEDK
jgi:hypothetical protein